MRPLSEAVPAFAKIDNLADENLPALDKALRNLTQRIYVPPSEQKGRIFLYSDAALAAIRLVYIAQEFGLDRIMLETFSRWLHHAGTRRQKIDGGQVGVSIIQEAVDRLRNGEEFGFHIVRFNDGQTRCVADWTRDSKPSERVERILHNFDTAEEIGRFTLPASRLISQLLTELG